MSWNLDLGAPNVSYVNIIRVNYSYKHHHFIKWKNVMVAILQFLTAICTIININTIADPPPHSQKNLEHCIVLGYFPLLNNLLHWQKLGTMFFLNNHDGIDE